MTLDVSPTTVAQGNAIVARLQNAATETPPVVSFGGYHYRMAPNDGLWWIILAVSADTTPGEYPLTVSSSEGQLSVLVTVTDAGYLVDQIYVPPDRESLLDPDLFQRERATLAAVYGNVTPNKLWQGVFALPAAGEFTDPFGTRRSYNGGPATTYHTGMDIAAEEGTPIVAANDGVVAFAGELYLRGNSVIIDHGLGVFTGYFHLSQISVQQGQAIAKGDLVGAMGQTGLVTGPHLHWELTVRGIWVDPQPWTQQEFRP